MLSTLLTSTLLTLSPTIESAETVPDLEQAAGDAQEFDTGDRKETKWIDRWPAEAGTVDLAVMLGLMPFTKHELFEPNKSFYKQGWKPLMPVAPEFGLRLGVYPGRVIGFEAEVSWLPTHLRDGMGHVNIWNPRGHLVFQIPTWSLKPFVLIGGGAMIIDTPREVLGKDVDQELHFGGGLKADITRHWGLRLDVRDVVSFKKGTGVGFKAHTFQGLLSSTWTFGRKVDKRVKKTCPTCPVAVAAPAPMPPELAEFNGIIRGIHFDLDKDTIRPRSRPVLDKAAAVLKKYDDVDVLIVGHTDNWGSHGHNVDLSKRRALRVKRFLVANGVAASRISTDGKSFDEPIASNKTKRGRSMNRRIVFHIED